MAATGSPIVHVSVQQDRMIAEQRERISQLESQLSTIRTETIEMCAKHISTETEKVQEWFETFGSSLSDAGKLMAEHKIRFGSDLAKSIRALEK